MHRRPGAVRHGGHRRHRGEHGADAFLALRFQLVGDRFGLLAGDTLLFQRREHVVARQAARHPHIDVAQLVLAVGGREHHRRRLAIPAAVAADDDAAHFALLAVLVSRDVLAVIGEDHHAGGVRRIGRVGGLRCLGRQWRCRRLGQVNRLRGRGRGRNARWHQRRGRRQHRQRRAADQQPARQPALFRNIPPHQHRQPLLQIIVNRHRRRERQPRTDGRLGNCGRIARGPLAAHVRVGHRQHARIARRFLIETEGADRAPRKGIEPLRRQQHERRSIRPQIAMTVVGQLMIDRERAFIGGIAGKEILRHGDDAVPQAKGDGTIDRIGHHQPDRSNRFKLDRLGEHRGAEAAMRQERHREHRCHAHCPKDKDIRHGIGERPCGRRRNRHRRIDCDQHDVGAVGRGHRIGKGQRR